MRRKKQALSPEETSAILKRGTSGVLEMQVEHMSGKEAIGLKRQGEKIFP